MPYNPSLPVDHSPNSAAEMRAQLGGLKDLIDAVPAGPPGPPGPAPTGADTMRASAQSIAIGGTGPLMLPFTAPSANLGWSLGLRLRASSAADPSNWIEGPITALSTTSVTIDMDTTSGAGAFADWILALPRVRPITATSTDIVTIGTTSLDLAYTASAPVGWRIGTRLRASSRSDPTNWFEGVITALDASTLHLEADASGGINGTTLNDWDLAPPPLPSGFDNDPYGHAVADSSANSNTVPTLDTPFADPDAETLRQKMNELLAALRR